MDWVGLGGLGSVRGGCVSPTRAGQRSFRSSTHSPNYLPTHPHKALLDDHFVKTHIHSFIHGPKTAGVNNDKESNLIITLTEIDYDCEEEGLER